MMDDLTQISEPQQKVTEALRALVHRAEQKGALITPRGSSHLGIANLDAVFSLDMWMITLQSLTGGGRGQS